LSVDGGRLFGGGVDVEPRFGLSVYLGVNGGRLFGRGVYAGGRIALY